MTAAGLARPAMTAGRTAAEGGDIGHRSVRFHMSLRTVMTAIER